VDTVRRAAAEAPLDLLQVEYQQMVPVASGVRAAQRVLDLHNVESSLVESYASARRGPSAAFYRAEAKALRHMESHTIADFDHVIVVSEKEKTRLPAYAGSVLICPNGREPSGLLPEATTPTVAFVATMGWAPNVDAALWLGREIWPLVVEEVPDAQLLLIGRGPTPEILALAGPGVEVTGTVAEVAPYLARARVVVAPLRAGGGTRLKIMEALDSGRPVVATSIGCEGLEDLVGRGVILADTTSGMADEIVRLLHDPPGSARLGVQGHDAVDAEHTWDIALRPLLQAVGR
jgi:glycosyltransferase involved in cell wall biosynthesis